MVYGDTTSTLAAALAAKKMNISLKPITCTFAKIGEAVVLDPNLDEEKVMSARLTVSHDENGVMRAMQKGKNGAFTVTEVKEFLYLNSKPINFEPTKSPNSQNLPDVVKLNFAVNILSTDLMFKKKSLIVGLIKKYSYKY